VSPLSPTSFRPAPVALWRAGLLALVVALIWCAHHDRWSGANWRVPTDYGGDAPEVLATIKAAGEGELWPLRATVIDRLGAPFGADWNEYPTPDKLVLILLGGLSRTVGVFVAANLGQLFAVVSAALAFWLVARWLRCQWEWAAAGALLFAFNAQTFQRGLGHFSLTLTWTIPLGLLAVWLVAGSRRLEWRRPGALICLVAAIGFGTGNPYHLLFWLQLMGWALIVQWLGRRRRANLAIGLASLGLAAGVFVLSHAEYWMHRTEPGAPPLLARNYGGTEIYALRPVKLLIPPPTHRWEPLAFPGQRHLRWSVLQGEGVSPYLGLVGVAGVLWLAATTIHRAARRRPLPGQALSVSWLIAYATMGGLTNLVALAGLLTFRATNRVAIFIAGLVLFFLVVRLSRATAGWPRWSRLAAALGVAAFGVLDQLPRPMAAAKRERIAADVRADEALGRQLEAALPEGAMVFQLPILGFPEESGPHRMGDYELFRPYLTTHTLRFSYGAVKFRAPGAWQQDLVDVSPEEMVRRLEAAGFSALQINRRAYADRAEALLAELQHVDGGREVLAEAGAQVFLRLNPPPDARPPLGRGLSFGGTWHPRMPDGVRWAYDDAVLSYYNPHDAPLSVDIELTLVAVSERQIAFELGGRRFPAVTVGENPTHHRLSELTLDPGVNILTLRSSQPARRGGAGPYQLRSFGVMETALELRAPAPGRDQP